MTLTGVQASNRIQRTQCMMYTHRWFLSPTVPVRWARFRRMGRAVGLCVLVSLLRLSLLLACRAAQVTQIQALFGCSWIVRRWAAVVVAAFCSCVKSRQRSLICARPCHKPRQWRHACTDVHGGITSHCSLPVVGALRARGNSLEVVCRHPCESHIQDVSGACSTSKGSLVHS